MEGYAWNIEISVEPPSSFYIWVDGIQNGTKRITFLAYDQVVAFPMEVQPSHMVRNGTYVTKINWSYESASGYSTQKSTTIMIFIGEEIPYIFPMYWVLIIMVVAIIVASIILFLQPRLSV